MRDRMTGLMMGALAAGLAGAALLMTRFASGWEECAGLGALAGINLYLAAYWLVIIARSQP